MRGFSLNFNAKYDSKNVDVKGLKSYKVFFPIFIHLKQKNIRAI
jgi:hypothetical protein